MSDAYCHFYLLWHATSIYHNVGDNFIPIEITWKKCVFFFVEVPKQLISIFTIFNRISYSLQLSQNDYESYKKLFYTILNIYTDQVIMFSNYVTAYTATPQRLKYQNVRTAHIIIIWDIFCRQGIALPAPTYNVRADRKNVNKMA